MKFNSHDELVNASKEAQKKWRLIPAPKRGEIIREFGNELRNQKADLAKSLQKKQEKLFLKQRGKSKKQLICVISLLV